MNEKITFCEDCRKDSCYLVEEIPMEGKLKGENYEFIGLKAVCEECGNEVYAAEIGDFNLKALYDEYRKKNHIISLERILELPRKYNIGKRPLSLILGWGEMTFTRYCDGDMPTLPYSEILEKIDTDPEYFLSLLEENKGNLKSRLSYEKSKRYITEQLSGTFQQDSKINLASSYLLYQCEDITPLAMQKALYYIQGFYYAFTQNFLFLEDCEAWISGPVYRDIYDSYANYQFDPIASENEFDATVFTEEERAIIDSIIGNICCYSGKVLESFTNSEMPWINTRSQLLEGMYSSKVIEKEEIGKFFINIKETYKILTPEDIGKYSHILFQRLGKEKKSS